MSRRLSSGDLALRTTLTAAALTLAFAGTSSVAGAQELSPAVANRCVRAAVKIVGLAPDGTGSTGSGSLIDARGYILTNFHVVGHLTAEGGVPGTLINADNRYTIATVESARQSARPRFIAAVVRADVRLDLALLRILSDDRGRPVRGAPFSTVEIGHTQHLQPGAALWAFGFPLGVRTINVTGGHLTGFEMNARDEVAWLRSDAEFNPGNSGGMLVDSQGRLMAVPTQVLSGGHTLEPVELARPAERIPRRWLAELRRGQIDNLRMDGVPTLSADEIVVGEAIGDRAWFSRGEIHYFLVPPHTTPARLSLEGIRAELLVGTLAGETLARGQGSLELPAAGQRLLGGVVLPAHPERPVHYGLRFSPSEASAPAVAAAPTPADTQAARDTVTAARAGAAPPTPGPSPSPTTPRSPFATASPGATPASRGPGQGGAQRPSQDSAGVAAGRRVTIRGRMLDAMSGRPVSGGLVVLGQPGTPLRSYLTAFFAGRISETQLNAVLVQTARTDVSGAYTLTQVPADTVYPSAGVARGYPPAILTITVNHEAPVIDLNPIQMTR